MYFLLYSIYLYLTLIIVHNVLSLYDQQFLQLFKLMYPVNTLGHFNVSAAILDLKKCQWPKFCTPSKNVCLGPL